MTIWVPDLARAPGPKYLAIAEAIERDVASDQLAPGSRLPAQRDLARELGVTVGTVGRGYAEARRRGLLTGEVGRGTFVRSPTGEGCFGLAPGDDHGLINLAHNAPHFAGLAPRIRQALAGWPAGDLEGALGYQSHLGSARHRRAGAAWLRGCGIETTPEEIAVTCGAQHAMLVAFSTLAEPGDLILAEELSYPGLMAVARFLHLHVEGVAVDGEGLVPEAFEQACRRSTPRALYCTPTIQNPTATVLGPERRAAIAEIAAEHGVSIIEDDTYAFLVDAPPPPLTSLEGVQGLYLTSLSKSLVPGLRVGFMRAPADVLSSVADAMMTTTIMASSLAAELATVLIENGTAGEIAGLRRREIRDRQTLVRELLGRHLAEGVRPESAHVWVELPEPWRAEEFTAQARARGVAVAPAEMFAVGRSATPHAVRLSLNAEPDPANLRRALDILADLLNSPPAPRFAGL